MKKPFLALSIISMCACLTACNKEETKINLFYAYSTENLMGDLDYLCEIDEFGNQVELNAQYRNRDYVMRFSCLKGENEACQLIINPEKYINSFDFTLPSVTNGVDTIDASNFEVYAEYYTFVSGSNETGSYAGYYPDAIIPLENYKFRRMNYIESGRNQGLFFNFKSTLDMKAGTYTGTGKLNLDGKITDIPFEVKIYDAELPQDVHNESCFLIWYDQISSGEKKHDGPEMQKKYYDFVVDHRLSPDQLPDLYEITPQLFAESFATEVANNPRITNYRMPCTGGGFNESNIKAYLNALISKNIEMRRDGDEKVNFFNKLIFYVDDEPTAERMATVREHDQLLYRIKRELSSKLNAYPDLKESFLRMKNIVTTPYQDAMVGTEDEGGVQCWCPQFTHFATQANRDKYVERQNLSKDGNYTVTNTSGEHQGRVGGENVWWYGCMDPQSPFCSYHLDADLLNSRILDYMQFDYRVEGEIYWNVCFYSKYFGGNTGGRDIWNDPITWQYTAGDGALVYPGLEFGINGPISTLRFESILGSREEYEYLWYIEQKVNEFNETQGQNIDVRECMQDKVFNKLYKDAVAINDNGTVNNDYESDKTFNNVRLQLLDLVETFSKDTNAGVAKLLRK